MDLLAEKATEDSNKYRCAQRARFICSCHKHNTTLKPVRFHCGQADRM